MGLSPYGTPKYADAILGEVIFLKPGGLFELNGAYFRHFKEGVNMSWEGGSPDIDSIFSDRLVEKFGIVRKKGEPMTQYHKDIAASVQQVTETVIFHIAEDLYQKTGIENICITGGCAQNSVVNGKLIQNTSYKKLFVPPAGHDADTPNPPIPRLPPTPRDWLGMVGVGTWDWGGCGMGGGRIGITSSK